MKLSYFKFFEWKKKKREKKFESLFYISSYINHTIFIYFLFSTKKKKKKETISLIIWSSILSFIFYEKIIDRIFEQTTEKQFSTKTET